MAARSDNPHSGPPVSTEQLAHPTSEPLPELGLESGARLEQITDVLVRVAGGDFSARAPRSNDGDPWDVLAFLVNATAEEVAFLVEQLREERRHLEEARSQLVQAEKLAALGELAGGVAHELNQPLTAIQTLSELLLEKGSQTIEQRRGDLELILSAAMRMGRIVSAVRTFGRKVPLDVREVPARHPLDDALLLLAESLRSARVIVAIDEEPGIPLLLCDAESLQQVFINLLSNARDALENAPAGHPRRIEIALRTQEGRARITVADSGPGIPEELIPRIFDPFFSTKDVGRGTGLGLSISHGIVSEHGGTLGYARGKNGGASFILDLPTKPALESITPPTDPSPT
jgi:two-component system, sensor histidine kinase AauS